MNIETRLAEILTALDRERAVYLVMGGHAARYYGVQRTTADYDLHLKNSTGVAKTGSMVAERSRSSRSRI